MYVSIISQTSDIPLYVVYHACRTCYSWDPEDRSVEEKRNLVRKVIKNGHESVLEHVSYTFEIKGITRACSHQLVRHRIASYSQLSQRHCSEIYFLEAGKVSTKHEEVVAEHFRRCYELYRKLLASGVKKEDARFVLPEATLTNIIVTMNVRQLRHFFKLRLAPDAQWEIREVARLMLQQCKEIEPVFFEDFEE